MFIVIPLGGVGKRFKLNGYREPKALIKVLGKPILYYLLENLNLDSIEFVCIPYNKEYYSYRLEDMLRKDFPKINFKFLCLETDTSGAAESLYLILNRLKKEINQDKPFLSLDGDNFYTIDIIKQWNGTNKLITAIDKDSGPIYSFVKVSNQNKITDIIEKKRISNFICTGAYGFKSYYTFLHYCESLLTKQKDELYISTVINKMINEKIEFTNCALERMNWTCLGTPFQVRSFCNNFPLVSCKNNKNKIKKQRICFDLDNTLVTIPLINGDYSTVKPIQKNINFLKYLRKFGHTIIIYTARRMKTHNSNLGNVMADIGKITFETLDKFEIPYDEIYFGKPYANIYIDDAAINAFVDLEKSTGFYIDSIKPRDFNTLEENSLELFTKRSTDLSGEIYYYCNIPSSIKDMFPLIIDYDKENYTWYKMEKIKGLTLTSIYLSELMTETLMENIMNSIRRIHNTEIQDEVNINIYENYANKLTKRYEQFDYSLFPNSDIKYNNLIKLLKQYELEKHGKCCVIHGDTVMTNILINNHEKIKFIDMRGKMGNRVTLYGDYLYDWAKLYQSLIGYDEILQNKSINETYKKEMITIFENYFRKYYSEEELKWVKIITKSLFFSLIPLHNDEKCKKYYNLA